VPALNEAGEVRAAGALVLRGTRAQPELLLIHRPAGDDWSMPKGKVRRGEDDATAALREVAEETGLVGVLGPELARLHYRDGKLRPKCTRYWSMCTEGATPVPNAEADRFAWLALPAAADLVTRLAEGTLLRRVHAALLAAHGDEGPPAVVEEWEPTDLPREELLRWHR
jgi:8-oxo-dGTP pyrophosphatase MutT (NUDIX family)